jgi:phenylacetate-coenzyme A ligase PaaK-like adenylate-forming protein
MVKLRGINIFPHAIGALIEKRADLTGEYVCRVSRQASGRDEMLVVIESRGGGPTKVSCAECSAKVWAWRSPSSL